METLLPATWQESEVPWRSTQAKDISVVAGGRPHWLLVPGGRAGCHHSSQSARLPAVEFFRVFLSHHMEPVCNGSILETKEKKARKAWLVVVTVRYGAKRLIYVPGTPRFQRLQTIGAQHRVHCKLVPLHSPLRASLGSLRAWHSS